MLIKIAPGAEEQRRAAEAQGQTALYVPDWYRDRVMRERYHEMLAERGRRIVEATKRRQLEEGAAYREEQDRALRDTKPGVLLDRSAPGRPVFVVGAGQLWREDLRDLARRTLEKPDPAKEYGGPQAQRHMENTIDMMAEANKWKATGRVGIWHIRNNPATRSGDA